MGKKIFTEQSPSESILRSAAPKHWDSAQRSEFLPLAVGTVAFDGKMLEIKKRILRIVEKKVLERDISVVCWDVAPQGILACFSQSTLGEPHVFFAWHLLIAHSGSDVGPRSWSMIEKRYSWQISVLMFSVCLWRVDSWWLTGITRNYIYNLNMGTCAIASTTGL